MPKNDYNTVENCPIVKLHTLPRKIVIDYANSRSIMVRKAIFKIIYRQK